MKKIKTIPHIKYDKWNMTLIIDKIRELVNEVNKLKTKVDKMEMKK